MYINFKDSEYDWLGWVGVYVIERERKGFDEWQTEREGWIVLWKSCSYRERKGDNWFNECQSKKRSRERQWQNKREMYIEMERNSYK